jgi:peptidoglycan/xylan/chitin deacetylase (PgdA/CDA1 family)
MSVCINQVNTDQKLIALTFDDGPDPIHNFVIGEALEKHMEVAQAAYAEGHELGNHTYSHPNLTELDDNESYLQLERAEQRIAGVTGEKPRLFRPPYLAYDQRVVKLCERFGYVMVGGVNHNTRDWAEPGVGHIAETVRTHVGNGSIILLHDSGGDRSQTVEAVRILVPEMMEQGYRLVTVSELLQQVKE